MTTTLYKLTVPFTLSGMRLLGVTVLAIVFSLNNQNEIIKDFEEKSLDDDIQKK